MTAQRDSAGAAGRLKALRKQTGLSIRATAEAIGMPPSTYSSYEDKYRKPFLPLDLTKRLAPVFARHGVSETDVMALAGLEDLNFAPKVTDNNVSNIGRGQVFEAGGDEFARIPVYEARFSAGYGAYNEGYEQPSRYYSMNMEMLRSFSDAPVSHLLFVKAAGDSMEPLLSSGDWVMVDTRLTRLSVPAIYCFINGDDAVIKHASQNLETGEVTLISENPLYAPQPVADPEKLLVIGRVVFTIRKT